MRRNDRGSLLIIGAFVFVAFMMVAAMGVDLSRYFHFSRHLQESADQLALAGTQSISRSGAKQPEDAIRTVNEGVRQRYGEVLDLKKHVMAHEQTGTDTHFRTGVILHETFEPYFLPRRVFGDPPFVIRAISVAEIRPHSVRMVSTTAIECGIYADVEAQFNGNNFDGSQADFCSNGNVIGGESSNGMMGDVLYGPGGKFTPPGGGNGTPTEMQEKRELPDFMMTNPADYDVVLDPTTIGGWTDCSWGSGKQMTTSDGDTVVWSNGGTACVTESGSVFDLDQQNNKGQLQLPNGDPVGIYARGGVTMDGNGNGIDGGLYAKGRIEVWQNDSTFDGDPNKLGGLAMWSEDSVYLDKNNITIRGILGSDGDITMERNGGGDGPFVYGTMISDGTILMKSNSKNAEFAFDPSQFASSALDYNGWNKPTQKEWQPHAYVNSVAELIL